MIGAADWREGGLRVRQLLCTQMRAERAMLECFASWLAPDSVLSSYNGRCYDAPLLAARYRLSRIANPLSGLRHLDLLFPVRRRFRGVWENCRLATAETALAGHPARGRPAGLGSAARLAGVPARRRRARPAPRARAQRPGPAHAGRADAALLEAETASVDALA
jgi:hypothetical protein